MSQKQRGIDPWYQSQHHAFIRICAGGVFANRGNRQERISISILPMARPNLLITSGQWHLSHAKPAAWKYYVVHPQEINLITDGDKFRIGKIQLEIMIAIGCPISESKASWQPATCSTNSRNYRLEPESSPNASTINVLTTLPAYWEQKIFTSLI